MAEGLEETEKMKTKFISSVSHELRTPLTSIRGWVETLRTLDDPSDENYRKGLEIINNETAASTTWWRSCWISAVCRMAVSR